MRHLTLRLVVASLMLAGLPAAGGAFAADPLPARSTSQAGVTIKAQPREMGAQGAAFEVVFDTHTQELKDDLLKTAVLVIDGGQARSPVAWKGDAAGGHHRKGVLRFGPVAGAPRIIELRIARAGESAPRVFRWQLQDK